MGVDIDEKTRNVIFKMNDAFFSMFSSYNTFIVEDSLKTLSKKEVDIISLLYGLDGEHCLDYDEIADKYNIDIDEVDEIIECGINKLKSVLSRGEISEPNKYKTLIDKYGKERVTSAFEQLDEEYRKVVEEYYISDRRITLKKLASKYSLTIGVVYYRLNEAIKRIEYTIENKFKIIFYDKFKGFEKEVIDDLLLTLSEQERDIVNLYYGLKEYKKTLNDIAKKYGMTTTEVYGIINDSINKVRKGLSKTTKKEKTSSRNRSREDFYARFQGCSKEQIDVVLNNLSDKQRKLLVLYYGLDGNEAKNVQEISSIVNVKTTSVNSMIYVALKNIEDRLNGKSADKTGGFYSNFNNYTKQQVDEALLLLKDRDREMVELCYGLKGEKLSQKEIGIRYNTHPNYVSLIIRKAISKIQEKLENPSAITKKDIVKVTDKKTEEEVLLKEESGIEEKFSNYREGNNKWLYDYLVNGNKEALKKLIEKNMKLVHYLVKKYYKSGSDYDDLISVASISLMDAVRSFKVDLIGKINFATYATAVIRNAIFMEYRRNKKYEGLKYFSDPVLGDDEDLTLEDQLASEEDFVEDLAEEEDNNNKKKKVFEALKTLDERERIIVEYLYGFRDGKKYTQVEIAKIIGVSQSYVARLVSSIIEKLSGKLEEYKEDYTFVSEKNETALRMSKVFFGMFEDVKKETVLHSLSKFKDNNLVYLYYGLDEKICLDYDEIADKLNLSVDEVIDKIDKIIDTLLKVNDIKVSDQKYVYNKYKYIVEKYGVNEVEDALQKISVQNRNMFLDYYLYSLELEEIYSKYDIDNNLLHNYLNKIFNKIVKLIISNEPVTREEKFYALFQGFTSEEVNGILSQLEEKERKIIEYNFGLKGKYLTQQKIAKKYELSGSYIALYVKRITSKIGALLEASKGLDRDDFYNKFNGYTQEKVDNALSQLSKKDIEIINLFYGIKDKRLSIEEISARLNVEQQEIYERVYKSINNIVKILNNDKRVISKKGKKKKSGYEELVSKYGEEAVLRLLEEFSDEKKELFKDYYGIERKPLERQDLIDKYGVVSAAIYQRLNSITKKMNEALQNSETIISKKKKFEKLFDGYDLKELYKLVEKLDDKEKDYIKSYYELGEDYLSKDELFSKYGYSTVNFGLIKNVIDKLKRVLDNPSKSVNKTEGFYKSFDGYSKAQVHAAIKCLREKDRNFIKEFIGLGVDMLSIAEMAKKYGVSRQACFSKKDRIIGRINNILKEKNFSINQSDFYSLFEGASKEKVDDAFKCLSDEERNILNLIYGLNCIKVGINEVARKYNITCSSVSLKRKKSIEKMKKYIINPNFESDDKKAEFYANFEGYSREKVAEAMAKLDKVSFEILSLYFGFENKPLLQREIAQRLHMNIGSVSNNINRSIRTIKELLENPDLTIESKKEERYQSKLKDKRKDQYKVFIEKYGEEKVLEEINNLSDRDKGILKDYYGLGSDQLLISEIAVKYNISKSYVCACACQTMKKIEKRLESPDKFTSLKSKFYERFEGYNEEEVKKIFALLNPNEQEIIGLYYGLGIERQTASEIAKKYGYKGSRDVTTMINKRLKKVENMLNSKESFYSLFEGFSEEQVNEALAKLKEKPRGILKDYYGIGTIKLKTSEIAQKYGVNSITYVSFFVRKGIEEIRNRLNNPLYNKKVNEFYANFEGHTKEEVDKALSKLDDRSKYIISNAFGLENESVTYKDIGLTLGVSISVVSKTIYSSIEKIKAILEEKNDRKFKFEKLVSKYGEELVKTSIVQLSDSEKGFLVLYYTLENVKSYSLSEISRIVGVQEDKLSLIEEKILGKLEQTLDEEYKKIKIEEMRKEFQYQIYNKNNLKYIKEILSKAELNLVGLYYGLNGKDIMSIDEFSEKLNVDKDVIVSMIEEAIRKINNYTIGGRK